jgi:hypothetical protein
MRRVSSGTPPPSDQDAFAGKVQAELRKRLPDDTFRYDPEGFRLIATTRADLIVQLGPTYEHYRAAPFWKRSRVIPQRLQSLMAALAWEPPTLDQVRAWLRPKIRERILVETMRLQAEVDGRDPVPFAGRVLAEHLTLEVALDQPGSILSVSQENLDEWGMSFEDALAQANQNLLKTGTDRFRPVRPGLFVSAWNDEYDCSRLHLVEVIESVPVQGRPVAMIPHRNCLLLTGADDAAGLVQMAKIAEDMLAKPGAMCGLAFRLDGGWTPFLPPREHAAFPALGRQAAQTLASYYAQQKSVLDALQEKRGTDLFIASPIVYEDKATKQVASVSTWAEGVDTLLPRTDEIAFLRPGAEGGEAQKAQIVGRLAWETAYPLLSDLMDVQADCYPERYRVRSFPAPARFAALPWQFED